MGGTTLLVSINCSPADDRVSIMVKAIMLFNYIQYKNSGICFMTCDTITLIVLELTITVSVFNGCSFSPLFKRLPKSCRFGIPKFIRNFRNGEFIVF